MKPKVYIETTIVSYLAARPSRDIVVAAHQQITYEWWHNQRQGFHLLASQLVIAEAQAGDADLAQKRLSLLQETKLLQVTDAAAALAEALITGGAVPRSAMEDALHIAIAVVNGIDYLTTWNCKHIANAQLRSKIDHICRTEGYMPLIICTPEELLEG
jgi:hypothetical protein